MYGRVVVWDGVSQCGERAKSACAHAAVRRGMLRSLSVSVLRDWPKVALVSRCLLPRTRPCAIVTTLWVSTNTIKEIVVIDDSSVFCDDSMTD